MTTLHISPALTAARLAATLQWLDADPSGNAGNGQAALWLMSGHWPGAGAEAPADAVLATIPLGRPCGEVSDGVLRLGVHADSTTPAMVQRTGEALWARLHTASGEVALDMPISALQIAGAAPGTEGGVQLYAGGLLPLVALELG